MEAGSVVRAVFEFLPSVSEELPLFTGDVIEVLSVVDEFWLLGNKDGVTGNTLLMFASAHHIGDVVVSEAGGTIDLREIWQRGYNAWGNRGLFPTSCLKELNLSGHSRQLSERSAQAQASDLPPYALGQARALMSLHAQLNEELDFREGDLIIITGLPEPGWFKGELEGRRGIFPEGFVELLGPLRSPQEPEDYQYFINDAQQITYEDPDNAGEDTEEEGVEEGELFLREEEDHKEGIVEEEEEHKKNVVEEEESGIYGVALYEFRAMEAGELDFDVGDHIRVVGTLEDGWLEGELQGRRGIFPHRFVKIEGGEQKSAEDTNVVKPEEHKENSNSSDYSSGQLCPSGSGNDSEWTTYEDHTVWDLDYFERTEEERQSKSSGALPSVQGQREGGSRFDLQPKRPVASAQRGPERPKSTPPARPKLPPRPNLSVHSQTSGTTRSNFTNGNSRSIQPRLTHSLTLPSTQPGWSKGSRYYQRPPADGATTSIRNASLGQTFIDIDKGHRQKKLIRHASVTDADVLMGSAETKTQSQQSVRASNGMIPTPITLDALATSAIDLETKLFQQMFEFEKSLTASYHDTNTTPESLISRHFSILDFSNESDIIRGSSHSPVSHLSQSESGSSSLERRRTLRPPPPRPRARHSLAPAAYKPVRPAPRPPRRCPRQNIAPPASNSPTSNPIVYTHENDPDINLSNPVTEQEAEFGDLAAAQEHDIQCQQDAEKDLERQMEIENQRQREEEERYQLLLRLQEVEHDMEAYAHTAEELRAMLEEEEEETARTQALENLEFCNYTLETLALEQQQLQGAMKSPVVYGNPATFGAVDWNYAAGAPVKRGKSIEELGDAGWARERERVAHLQHIEQLHQLQLQQQQVGYPGYGVVSPGQPQGTVKVASPSDTLSGYTVPTHGGVMVPVGGPVHVPAPWPVQWGDQAQIRQGNVCRQPSWEHNDQHKKAFKGKQPPGHDVYFHPRSEDGHLELRISEWKGKHCFYQGPEDYSQQKHGRVQQEKASNDFRTEERYGKEDKDIRRRDDWVRENDHNSEQYDHYGHTDLEDYDQKCKYQYRDHYDRRYNAHYDDREQQYYANKRHPKYDRREPDSDYEEYYNRKEPYVSRDRYKDADRYHDHDRDYYDSKESRRYRENDYYQRREEDPYYDERKQKDPYYDRRSEGRYDRREDIRKDRDVHYRRCEDSYTTKDRDHDSEPDEYGGYRERNKYKDRDDGRRDDPYDHRKSDNYRAKERYERRTMDHCDYENEERYGPREGEYSHYKPRDRFRDLRSISTDSRYEDYPKKDRKTHCEEWVEQQKKLVLREVHSFEDPGIYRHSDDQEKGFESSAGNIGSKQGRKAVYVGSLDRNSFYRKTAPSALRKSEFATTRRPGKKV
ncbi:Dynamin-binding protein Scaffold protein Tuba [Channa argus]|uniref:Dynamin-binding protein Scaffold protein Tuba n=1 Tax=Channa argus TaxID=215402 RepID=A0A6G1QPH5_CHAAH|nr:Dynamin-binding protein Scaffold protein Tuba [Channa argus]